MDGDIIKIVSITIGSLLGLSGAVWMIVKFASSKDSSINKAYNRGLEKEIEAQGKLFDTKNDAVKEDVSEIKTEVSNLIKGMSEMTTEIRISNEINKEVAETNKKILVGKDDEIDLLRRDVDLHEQQVQLERMKTEEEIKLSRDLQETTKTRVAAIMEGVEVMLNDSPLRDDLLKFRKEISERFDKIESHTAEEFDEIRKIVNLWEEFTNGKCKNKMMLAAIREMLHPEDETKLAN